MVYICQLVGECVWFTNSKLGGGWETQVGAYIYDGDGTIDLVAVL